MELMVTKFKALQMCSQCNKDNIQMYASPTTYHSMIYEIDKFRCVSCGGKCSIKYIKFTELKKDDRP